MPFEKSKKELRARENAAGILGKYVDRCWNDLAFFLSHECMVKASPMSGRLCCVSSLASAIAICRGLATLRLRFFECMSDIFIL